MNVRVVTISRLMGAGGEVVADEVAHRLEFRLLDREVIEQAAREAGLSADTLGAAEQPMSLRNRLLGALSASPGFPGTGGIYLSPVAELPLPVRIREHRTLIENVVAGLPAHGGFVLLGHAGQAVLADRWDTLRVLITGSMRSRVRNTSCENGIELEDAARLVERSDRERADYMKERYGIDWLSPDHYDLCLNTDHIPPQRAADLICDEAENR